MSIKGFASISSVDPAREESWKQRSFLSLDIDWAHDDVLHDTIDLVERANVPVTWFVTHDTPVLARLKENPLFELGIHPNFNFLLQGDPRNGKDAQEVIGRLMDLLPDARAIRSHSATQSSYLFQRFAEVGLTHDTNCFIPYTADIALKPWHYWNDLVSVPYCWTDDVACALQDSNGPADVPEAVGLRVFDFHPIHIFLNTEHMNRYEETRPMHRTPDTLLAQRYQGGTRKGARDHVTSLLGIEGE